MCHRVGGPRDKYIDANTVIQRYGFFIRFCNIIDHTRARPPPDKPRDEVACCHEHQSITSAARGQSACRSWSLRPPYWGELADQLQKLAGRFMGVAGRRRKSVASLGWRETPKLGNWGLTPLHLETVAEPCLQKNLLLHLPDSEKSLLEFRWLLKIHPFAENDGIFADLLTYLHDNRQTEFCRHNYRCRNILYRADL